MADPQKLTGAQRASVLLLSLGEQDAAAVLKHMDAREVQAIGTAMATLKNVSRDDADSVLDAFAGSLGKQTSFGIGTEDYVRTCSRRRSAKRRRGVSSIAFSSTAARKESRARKGGRAPQSPA